MGASEPGYRAENLEQVYEELRGLAHRYLAKPGETLQPTALVNEAYLKLAGREGLDVDDREGFVKLAARVMRNIFVDHVRASNAQKRGGNHERVTLSAVSDDDAAMDVDILTLDAALDELAALDERKARLVELRFFGGMTETEAANTLGISRTEATRSWRFAKAWLQTRLGDSS